MTAAPPTGARSYARRCAQALNAFHSIPYFTADLGDALAEFGVTDPSSVQLASRAAPLGPVGAPLMTAVFNAFAPGFLAERVPALWGMVSPERVLAAREKAAGAALERLLGADALHSDAMVEAADLAMAAASGLSFPGRPLYAANAALPRPGVPHIALWHAATMLREHRGDGHITVLGHFELTGVEALVLDCASERGMAKELVMPQRGWTEDEWSAAQARLLARGLMGGEGALTARGTALRHEIERETDRLDRAPYASLGAADTEKLAKYVHRLVNSAAGSGAFIPQLRGYFAPDTETWNKR
ncbi:hypothetical protein [Streptomyces sp. ISL-11]|uniref:SCO6745 family protein n=1 Tax=Streptomyces sp. ISL-11 TaxID=2819174 RepID=UPI001BEC00EC|nr:hypothetical protein [Streptomyces sp. ISL-11]MBT2386699.1 hypothetical protein [Streptomyces sp. ISL-11]